MTPERKGLENPVHGLRIADSLLLLGLNLTISHQITQAQHPPESKQGCICRGFAVLMRTYNLLPAEGDKKFSF